jgi:N-acetylglucosaminyldiphosphoundecaprenol N-acetyl-beta-D-mannosaminyltransferase
VDTPPPGEEHSEAAIKQLTAARPDVVWCALGAPKQELWMARWALELSPALVLGVGAAFDFNAGNKQRAPAWMQTAGLEWLHRLGSEPRRLAIRYISTNALFIGAATIRLTRRRFA